MGVEEKALGQRLQEARQKAGLTQQELCQKASLSYSTLAKIERGAIRSPSVFTVATISRVTGVALDELLDLGTSSPAPAAKKTSNTGVKFVYFDLNGTLVHSYEKALTKAADDAGVSVDVLETYYWRYDDQVCDGRMSMDEFNAAIAKHLGIDSFDWSSYYLEAVEPVEGTPELIDWASQNYEIGLLSGTMPGLINGLAQQGKLPLDKFSKVIDSSVVKLLKYDPAIYKLAQQESGCQAGEILLVDDDKLSIINADRLGWHISRFDAYNAADSIAKVKQHLEF